MWLVGIEGRAVRFAAKEAFAQFLVAAIGDFGGSCRAAGEELVEAEDAGNDQQDEGNAEEKRVAAGLERVKHALFAFLRRRIRTEPEKGL